MNDYVQQCKRNKQTLTQGFSGVSWATRPRFALKLGRMPLNWAKRRVARVWHELGKVDPLFFFFNTFSPFSAFSAKRRENGRSAREFGRLAELKREI